MNTVLIQTAYIKEILDTNPNIQCIEVWDRVLYARMNKNCGRNTFISKKGLEFNLPVYYNESEYVSLAKRYHPDAQSGAQKRKESKQRTFTKLQQSINVSRPALSELFKGRRYDGINFTRNHALFTQFTLSKSSNRTNKLVERIGTELFKAGYSDDELFGRYCSDPLDKQIREHLQTIDNQEEILQTFAKTWADTFKKRREEDPEFWEYQEQAAREAGI